MSHKIKVTVLLMMLVSLIMVSACFIGGAMFHLLGSTMGLLPILCATAALGIVWGITLLFAFIHVTV